MQLDRVHVGSACGAEDGVELGVEAAHRRDCPAPRHVAAHRASRERAGPPIKGAMVLVNTSWTSGEHSQQLPQTSPRTQRRSKGGHAWINSIDFELELTVIF